MKQRRFSKDFRLVIVGQIISLFGNAAIRFALPLYLLNITGSSALYGTVTACAFIPTILLSPVGGIIADRVNKRNIMVVLDFLTAAIVIVFSLLMDSMNIVILLTIVLMLLYGIAGAYQPSVQASIPALVSEENYMAANSVINAVNSLANLLGPVLGGILYSVYGLKPVLLVCIVCFVISAVMEIFIKIPFEKQTSDGSILNIAKKDFSESIRFIYKEKPIIGKGLLIVCAINLFMSSMIIVGLPYLVTEVLSFDSVWANQLCGFAQGALAVGGLAGGVCAGIFGKRLNIQKAGNLLAVYALTVFSIGISLMLFSLAELNYAVITVCCMIIMAFSTIFTIQMMSFVQTETPQNLIGKVYSVILTVCMCAQPVGSALYGFLFEFSSGFEYLVVLFAGVASLIVALCTKGLFKMLPQNN
ncbi:MFS transporter [Ruminococcus sp.]|uniref:MFS transporter n=1 Tax=Ruminococcus sp. TaxID=41978 RepID=UPI003F0525DE